MNAQHDNKGAGDLHLVGMGAAALVLAGLAVAAGLGLGTVLWVGLMV